MKGQIPPAGESGVYESFPFSLVFCHRTKLREMVSLQWARTHVLANYSLMFLEQLAIRKHMSALTAQPTSGCQ